MPDFATVILAIPQEQGFTYRVPKNLKKKVKCGSQVVVPFQKRLLSGIMVSFEEKLPDGLDEKDIREIQDVVSDGPFVLPEMMRLLEWISNYYICHLGEAYRLIHASLNVSSARLLLSRAEGQIPDGLTKSQIAVLENIPIQKEISLNRLQKKSGLASLRSVLSELEKRNLIKKRFSGMTRRQPIRTEKYYRSILSRNEDGAKNPNRQKLLDSRAKKPRQLLEYLGAKEWVSEAELKEKGFGKREIEKLRSLDLLEIKEQRVERHFELGYREEIPEIVLTGEQQQFIAKASNPLKEKDFQIFLLHGITGSGKTQVYIELIRAVLEQGRQAIVLIPEIVLTPQTLTRFRHYFGDKVGVIHSRLSAGEKREVLYKVRSGSFQVVLGPRSAIFAPVKNLGLVIVDEEHESSYKQTDSKPHYHGRDVAIYRAYLNKAVVVLGSATPSFESLYNARQGSYKYFRLMKRIEARALPRVSIVDLREEWKRNGEQPVISENLELKMESRLLVREQIMILQNRRGYAPYILCRDCGYVAKCPNCDITLTFHQFKHNMLCHYCGYSGNAPDVCPQCGGFDLRYKGIGTQRLQEDIAEKFPHSTLLRMDQDTTRGKHGHLRILEAFRRGDANILLGTKMIAKGLDFRRVTLVGIASADQGLHFPDFRASEKVFQLLTQAAGRAGRGQNSGEVVVQTFDPSHFIFKYLLTHDYLGYYEQELESRKYLKYPPFSRLMLIRVEGEDIKQVQNYSSYITKFLWRVNPERRFSILGPAPAPLLKIRNVYRYHILIKQDKQTDEAMGRVRRIVKEAFYLNPEVRKWPVKLTIDMDPVEIL